MAREKIHASNAARQAAYRTRQAAREPAPQAVLARLGQELHGRLRQAIEAGTNRVPAIVLGRRADDTLINLIGYLTRGALPGEPGDREERPPGAPCGGRESSE
jgi:hypothetical protein